MVLVIAYGNPLRRDDGVGPALAQAAQRALKKSAVRWLCVQQLTPELAVEIAEAEAVVFLDASAGVEPAGTVSLRRAEGEGGAAGHFLSPEALMACVDLFVNKRPPAWVLTVAGKDLGHGSGLSEPVRRGMDEAERRLVLLVETLEQTRGAAACSSV